MFTPRFLFPLVILLSATYASPAVAGNEVGKPTGGGGSISWQIDVTGHESVLLKVATPEGDVFTREFNAGRDPLFRLDDLEEGAVDGKYTYELRVIPRVSANIKEKLAASRAADDDKGARRTQRNAGLLNDVVQSGTFTVDQGSILSPDAVENGSDDAGTSSAGSDPRFGSARTDAAGWTPVANAQVIADDLIVQGSACLGIDCTSAESFGFDTLRLKENNLRIKAEDTSTSTGYPATDWQLTFNDSASGGANKFSVEDITGAKVPLTIMSGASTNALFVDSSSRVGFGTATPVLDLHKVSSNTPAVRLEQTNAGGFTAQTWDVAGNEANFFVRDVTSGSRLPFRIRPGAPTSSIDINASGFVGVGTATPETRLDIDTLSNGSGVRIRGLARTTEVADLYLSNTGALVVSTVNGSGTQSFIDLRSEDDAYGVIIRASSGATTFPYGNVYVSDAADDVMTFDVNSGKTGDLALTASGKVGVGTTTPVSKFHVEGGDIRVSGGSFIDDGTTLNVPDYVFDESYSLMPLPELARYIREQKHLPNVPSAADVKAKGLNMSQMQMRLLEKVEELTLYTLEQHDTISTLRSQNDELRARLEKIEALLQQN